jgi:hypothetical protein
MILIVLQADGLNFSDLIKIISFDFEKKTIFGKKKCFKFSLVLYFFCLHFNPLFSGKYYISNKFIYKKNNRPLLYLRIDKITFQSGVEE